jgi:hypothetical protein
MKPSSLLTVGLLAAALAYVGCGASRADDSTAPSTPPPAADNGGGHHMSVLTPDERKQLMNDREQVLAGDADLKKEDDDLKGQRPGPDASQDDRQAFRAKWHDHMEKVRDAVLKLDPSAAAIYAKLDAAHKAHEQAAGGAGGGGQ